MSPEEIVTLRTRVRAVVEDLLPFESLLLQCQFAELMQKLEGVRERVRREGLWGLSLSRELGGHGLPLDGFAHLAEEMGRSPLGHYVFGCQAPEVGNIELVHHHGTSEQKQNILPLLVTGRARSCFAMTERNTSGANPTLLTTRARSDGAGWVIDGEKWFTTAADGAAFCIIMAVTDPGAPPHQRASLFLVPLPHPGLHFIRNISVMGHVGGGPFSHAELHFEGCRVGPEHLIGKIGDGFRLAQARLGHGRIHHCARWIGIAQRALDMMCERVTGRAISEVKTLSESDLVRSWIGEAAAGLTAARLFVQHTAKIIEEKGGQAARNEIAMIKFFVADVLSMTVDRALQTHGAAGVSDDFILAYFYREERAAHIYDGPDEVHKLSVAKSILKSKGGIDATRSGYDRSSPR